MQIHDVEKPSNSLFSHNSRACEGASGLFVAGAVGELGMKHGIFGFSLKGAAILALNERFHQVTYDALQNHDRRDI